MRGTLLKTYLFWGFRVLRGHSQKIYRFLDCISAGVYCEDGQVAKKEEDGEENAIFSKTAAHPRDENTLVEESFAMLRAASSRGYFCPHFHRGRMVFESCAGNSAKKFFNLGDLASVVQSFLPRPLPRMWLEAARKKDFVGIRYLRRRKDCNINEIIGDRTVLMLASAEGDVSTMRVLLDAGADVNAASPYDGDTALFRAGVYGTREAVELLLERGADPTIRSLSDHTALSITAEHGANEKVQALVAAGADVNALVCQGNTPLLLAAYSEDIERIETLLNAGANINAMNDLGHSALHIAAFSNPIAVQLLLDNGADPTILSNSGDTPLDIAMTYSAECEAILN